jgi:glyoxylase-like metal-dependent hydrolase (beta-lactamase superfamily II)
MEIQSFVTTPFAENAYVIKDDGEALVVDPGEATDELLAALDGFTVNTLVNTHCHIDHVGGNAAIVEKFGSELVCHQEAVPMLEHVSEQGAMFGLQVPKSPAPTRYLAENDEVRVGNAALKVLYVPGHAPGHIALLGDGFVLSGDVLFAGSIGRVDLPGGDYATLMDSIRTRLMPLPDDTVVYSGHGPATTIGRERATNPFSPDFQ